MKSIAACVAAFLIQPLTATSQSCAVPCPAGNPLLSFTAPECAIFILQLGAVNNGSHKPENCGTCDHCNATFFVTFVDVSCDPPMCIYYRNSLHTGRYRTDPRLWEAAFGCFSLCDNFGENRFWIRPCDSDAPLWADPNDGWVHMSCGC